MGGCEGEPGAEFSLVLKMQLFAGLFLELRFPPSLFSVRAKIFICIFAAGSAKSKPVE
jgi:hypothetical protein